MNKTIKRLLRAGWVILKWTTIAGGAILLTLHAPAVAAMVAALPVSAYVAEKTKDVYLTMVAGAAAGLLLAVIMIAAPEAAAIMCAFGLYELKKRWGQYINLRKAQERVALAR